MSPVLTGTVREGQWHSCSMPHSLQSLSWPTWPTEPPASHHSLCMSEYHSALRVSTQTQQFPHLLISCCLLAKSRALQSVFSFLLSLHVLSCEIFVQSFIQPFTHFLVNAEMPRGKLKVGLILKLAVLWLAYEGYMRCFYIKIDAFLGTSRPKQWSWSWLYLSPLFFSHLD